MSSSSSDSFRIEIDFPIEAPIRRRVLDKLRAIFESEEQVQFPADDGKIDMGVVDPGLVISLASLIVSLTSLILTVRQRHKDAQKWSPEKLKEAVEAEMLSRGIVGGQIQNVTNFEYLLEPNVAGPCVVEVASADPKPKTFKVYLFRDGDAYTLKLQA